MPRQLQTFINHISETYNRNESYPHLLRYSEVNDLEPIQ